MVNSLSHLPIFSTSQRSPEDRNWAQIILASYLNTSHIDEPVRGPSPYEALHYLLNRLIKFCLFQARLKLNSSPKILLTLSVQLFWPTWVCRVSSASLL